MSLDRLQSKAGMLQLSALPAVGSTGTASTIASNNFAGGYAFGSALNLLPATGSTGGGGQVAGLFPQNASSAVQSFATTGVIQHANSPVVCLSISTTGIALNLQPAVSAGQMLTLANIAGTTFSLVSTVNTTGLNGTTTAAVPVLDQAYTFASTQIAAFIALPQLGGTATSNTPFVWRKMF
jgi:hypothetical protein